MIDFIPPHNKEFEQRILGSILYESALMQKCILNPEDFYFGKHQQIYQIFLGLQERKTPIDLLTVGEALKDDTQGSEKLLDLNGYLSAVVSTANFPYYESQVKDLSLKRQLIKVFMTGISRIGESSAEETISIARQRFSEILSSQADIQYVTAKEVVKEVSIMLEKRANDVGHLSGIPSGLKDLDSLTDGFQPSDFIIIAGRPGSGKSALAMHIAQHAASLGFPVGIFHLEMGNFQVGLRVLSSTAALPMWKMQKGRLTAEEWSSFVRAAGKASEFPIWFSFSAMESRKISRILVDMVEEKGCKFIILDYLQLVQAKDIDHREREVATVSGMLKAAAKTYNIPVIAVAQLNRAVEKEKRKPRLSDLRESGAIEQDADVILFLHKEEEDKGPLEIIVGKGRNIGVGFCRVFWDRERMIFGDYREMEGR